MPILLNITILPLYYVICYFISISLEGVKKINENIVESPATFFNMHF